jgi:hypothetical protein
VHVADGREAEELFARRRRQPRAWFVARDGPVARALDDLARADVQREDL